MTVADRERQREKIRDKGLAGWLAGWGCFTPRLGVIITILILLPTLTRVWRQCALIARDSRSHLRDLFHALLQLFRRALSVFFVSTLASLLQRLSDLLRHVLVKDVVQQPVRGQQDDIALFQAELNTLAVQRAVVRLMAQLPGTIEKVLQIQRKNGGEPVTRERAREITSAATAAITNGDMLACLLAFLSLSLSLSNITPHLQHRRLEDHLAVSNDSQSRVAEVGHVQSRALHHSHQSGRSAEHAVRKGVRVAASANKRVRTPRKRQAE